MEFLRLVVLFFAAVNPAGVAAAMRYRDAPPPTRVMARIAVSGTLFALLLVLAAVVLDGRILDGLDVDAESWRIAAAMILAATGLYTLWTGRPGSAAPGEARLAHGFFPLGVPLLAGPATLAAAVSASADHGRGLTLVAACLWIVATGALVFALRGRGGSAIDGIARVTGGLLIVVAAGLAISGIQAI